jgi:Ca-activated chloride channel family protein
VVVLSDGWETTRDSLAAAARARSAHVELDYVRLSDPSLRDVAITQIHAPDAVHAGDPLPLQITVRSTVSDRATLYVERDGRPIGSQVVNLRTGDNPLLLSYIAPGSGWHSFEARIALDSDDVPQDDALATTVDVVHAPRVLVVSSVGSPAGALVDSVLRRDGLAVTSVTPGGFPTSAGSLGGFDAVVLDDVPHAAVGRTQVSALPQAVRTEGLGLMVLGGPHSFSLGGYAHTGLERLLPVASLVPGSLQRRDVAIELVLDRSGSMTDLAGGVPKIEMVHVAGTQVARFIAAHRDDLGVVDFDTAPHVLVAMQSLDNAHAARNAIAKIQGLQASGGTNIYAALVEGTRQLLKSPAPDKHMILMTDGISEPGKYSPLLARLGRDHVQVATIALGTDAAKMLLRDIATATGGHFYSTNDAHSLPGIFDRETRAAVKPVRIAGHVAVRLGADSPVIRSLAGGRLPALSGNVATTLKPGGQDDLLASGPSGNENPALAQWQDGAGRVVAFTPGIGAPFAASWSREAELWSDAVRWAQRGVPLPRVTPTSLAGAPPKLAIDLAGAGAGAFAVADITGTLTSRRRAAYPVDFRRVGPSYYQAAVPPVAPGVYSFDLTARAGVSGRTRGGLLAVPYSLEYLPRPAADTPLAPLAALTGGHELRGDEPRSLAGGGQTSLWWPLALAALMLFMASALGRQLDRPQRAGLPVEVKSSVVS